MEPLTLIQFLTDLVPDDYKMGVIVFETAEGQVFHKWWGSSIAALGCLAFVSQDIAADMRPIPEDEEEEESYD